jgi:hypothetical protein
MTTIPKFSIIEYGKNSEQPQLTEGDCLISDAKKLSPIKNLNCIMNVATQFLTHIFDKFLEKNKKKAKNNENPKIYIFYIFASFLAFSTSSQKNLNFQRYLERVQLLTR